MGKHKAPYRKKEDLSEEKILEWCRLFFEEHGGWPGPNDPRPVPGQPYETWSCIDQALRYSPPLRGLVRRSSLADLLEQCGRKKIRRNPPDLSEEKILEWCRLFFEEHGEWPISRDPRPVPGQPGETWHNVNACMGRAGRGLTRKNTLAHLLAEEDLRENRLALPDLSEEMVCEWCRLFFEEHGEWPTSRDTRPVPGHPNENWSRINSALVNSGRGLARGTTLARLVAKCSRLALLRLARGRTPCRRSSSGWAPKVPGR